MKKLIFIILSLLAIAGYGQTKISDMPEATNLGGNEIFPVVQSGSNKKVTFSTISSYFQPVDGDLTSIAGMSTTGFLQRTGVNTWATANINGISGLTTGRVAVAGSSTTLTDYADFTYDGTTFQTGSKIYTGGAFNYHTDNSGGYWANGDGSFAIGWYSSGAEYRVRTATTDRFKIDGSGHLYYVASPSNDNDLTQLIARDASTGQLKYRNASTFQEADAELTAIAGLTSSANQLPYFTGSGTASLTTFTSFARTLADDGDASTARATLGAQTLDTELTALAGTTAAANALPYFSGTTSATTTTLSSFGRTLIDDTDAATARETLDLEIGTDVQAYDADLAAIASLSGLGFPARSAANTWVQRSIAGSTNIGVSNATGASGNPSIFLSNAALNSIGGLTTGINQMIFTTSSNTYATTSLTTFARTLLDDTDAETGRGTLQIEEGTYTPTVTGITNVDGTSGWDANYYKVGNKVTVAGAGTINPTSSATVTVLEINLPVSLGGNFVGNNQGTGTGAVNAAFGTGAVGAAAIRAKVSDDVVEVSFTSLSTTADVIYFHFTYDIN